MKNACSASGSWTDEEISQSGRRSWIDDKIIIAKYDVKI